MTGMMPTLDAMELQQSLEYTTFQRLLPRLRAEHGGKYVALRNGRILAAGDCLNTVSEQVAHLSPNRTVYYGWAESEEDGVAFFGRLDIVN